MKIRTGFVSNSSSSSFVCDFCGETTSGWDMTMEEAYMITCEHGHLFCIGEIIGKEDYDVCDLLTDKDFLKDLIQSLEKQEDLYGDIKQCIEHAKKYIADEEDDGWYENCDDDIQYYVREEWGIPEKYCPVCNRKHEMEKDSDYVEYKRLYEKFNGVTPEGKKVI